ncbi:hypothetical protein [Pseudomonas aeruginosa]
MPDRFLRLFFALPCPPPLAERIGRGAMTGHCPDARWRRRTCT